MIEMEAIAITFTFALFDYLSTASVDFYVYHNLKVMGKVIITKHKMAAFNGD